MVKGLDEFVQKYVEPIYWSSQIVNDRFKLRNSKKVNNFLLDNEYGLTLFFTRFRDKRDGFTLSSAQRLI